MNNSNNVITVIIVLLVVGVVGYWAMNRQPAPATTVTTVKPTPTTTQTDQTMPDSTMDQTMPADNKSVTVKLNPVDGSNEQQYGTAVLTDTPDGLVVTVNVTGYDTEDSQPEHLHVGGCPGVGAIKYALENLKGGSATTVIKGVTLAQLKSELPLALNIHKSTDEIKVYTSCGDLSIE